MISELTNSPVSFKLAGKEVKVQRLSIGEIFSSIETEVKNQYIKNMESVAGFLKGAEKMEYIIKATKEIPSGENLHARSLEYINTPEGMAKLLLFGLNKCQKLEENEVTQMMLNGADDFQHIVNYMMGVQEDSTEKKT